MLWGRSLALTTPVNSQKPSIVRACKLIPGKRMFSKILGESTLMLAGCAGAIAIQAQLLSKAKDKPECAAAEAARQFEMPSDAEIAAMANAALSFERTRQRGERPALVPACD
ncbi:hypothetical protein EMIHUDRAFT_260360 [Emiliania huxleyi CCMP1516]|uniref:Uncharacterized protein n=2 Tax=Emiliania huxleyi TaxID=2903 RepID=A0A0D3KVV7_EMIH1|nr:hypothetical protein EMIHUDRAFT_260360 [Emiliania huxleyi CCMP1516]EOD39892.1 hypothetical protein EMIHUDRAFT_260360 [Emiliania huxleyi CCMP1516]|eukprot:XP_005792321.1 hypothetical protein EMIHUDRAFT_260360 [Emiliania huxleyi CCMP1516]